MGWVTGITGLFVLVIALVVVMAWAVSSGRVSVSWQEPYPDRAPRESLRWHRMEVTRLRTGPVQTASGSTPFNPHREHAHGRHEAQDR